MKLIDAIVLVLVLALGGLPGAAAAAGPGEAVGMVLDVQGNGEDGNTKARLQLLDYVRAGAMLKLEAGSRVSISHYASKLIYQLSGPATAQVGADKITVLSGAPAATKSLAEKVVKAVLNPNMGPAALKMRAVLAQSVSLTTPGNRTLVLVTRPEFEWEAEELAAFELTLTELPERVVASARVDGRRWSLPPGLALEHGKTYRWSVAAAGAGADAQPASALFSVATRAEADELQALAPGAGAAVDEWVLYASVLQGRGARDDARAVWRKVAQQRPDLAKAQSMAR